MLSISTKWKQDMYDVFFKLWNRNMTHYTVQNYIAFRLPAAGIRVGIIYFVNMTISIKDSFKLACFCKLK